MNVVSPVPKIIQPIKKECNCALCNKSIKRAILLKPFDLVEYGEERLYCYKCTGTSLRLSKSAMNPIVVHYIAREALKENGLEDEWGDKEADETFIDEINEIMSLF
jgi:hypothetical protein